MTEPMSAALPRPPWETDGPRPVARLCTDCGRDRKPGDDVLSFTPDSGWVAEFTKPLDPGEPLYGMTEQTAADGKRWGVWTEPVIGWAVVEQHFDAGDLQQRVIEPVLLVEDAYPEPLYEYKLDRDMSMVRMRLIPAPGPPPGG